MWRFWAPFLRGNGQFLYDFFAGKCSLALDKWACWKAWSRPTFDCMKYSLTLGNRSFYCNLTVIGWKPCGPLSLYIYALLAAFYTDLINTCFKQLLKGWCLSHFNELHNSKLWNLHSFPPTFALRVLELFDAGVYSSGPLIVRQWDHSLSSHLILHGLYSFRKLY